MLKEKTLSVITYYLNAELDMLLANKLHLDHQLSLPENHRVNDMKPYEMEEGVLELNRRIATLKDAIEDINNFDGSSTEHILSHKDNEEGLPGTREYWGKPNPTISAHNS